MTYISCLFSCRLTDQLIVKVSRGGDIFSAGFDKKCFPGVSWGGFELESIQFNLIWDSLLHIMLAFTGGERYDGTAVVIPKYRFSSHFSRTSLDKMGERFPRSEGTKGLLVLTMSVLIDLFSV